MCQVEEDDVGGILRSDNLPEISSWICCRCNSPAVIHLRDKDFKCQSCFIDSVREKFRAALAKFQVSRSKQRILLAYSGGPTSTALLHLIKEGLNAAHSSRLSFIPVIIHIEEGIAFDRTNQERLRSLDEVRNVLHNLGIGSICESHFCPLESIFAPKPIVEPVDSSSKSDALFDSTNSYATSLQQFLRSAKSVTAREELLKLTRMKLLRRIGMHLQTPMMFLGDSLDRLAVQLITNTALGKGRHLPMDLGFLDTRYPDFQIFRPFKDVTLKEVFAFNEYSGLDYVKSDLQPEGDPSKLNSVYRMTQKFVFDLQRDYPQTVTTLCRTADKLVATTKMNQKNASCRMCSGSLDNVEGSTCTAEKSIALSLKLMNARSAQAMDLEDVAVNGCHGGDGDCENKGAKQGGGCGSGDGCCSNKKKTERETEKGLCYSCRWLASEIADRSALPVDFIRNDERLENRAQMRAAIQEFLLDEPDDES